MTLEIADALRIEAAIPGVELLNRHRYAAALTVLTLTKVTLAEDVIGGYRKDNHFLPIRYGEISFDVLYNLRQTYQHP